jgi:hypothetical protein
MHISPKLIAAVFLLQVSVALIWGLVIWQNLTFFFPYFRYASAVLCTLGLILGWLGGQKSKTITITTAILTIVSVAILLWKQAPLEIWITGVSSYAILNMVIILIPTIAFPITIGKYNKALFKLLTAKANTTRGIQRAFQVMAYILGFVGAFGGIPLTYFSTEETANLVYEKEEVARAQVNGWLRGWLPGGLLSPLTTPMAICIVASGSTWSEAAPLLGIQSLLVFAVSLIFFAGPARPIDKSEIPDPEDLPSLTGFFMGAALLVVLISFVPIYTGLNPVWCLAVFALLVSIIWLTVIGKVGSGFAKIKRHLTKETGSPAISGMVAMVYAIGLLGVAIEQLPEALSAISNWVAAVQNAVGPLGVLLFIALIHIPLAYVGVVPLIVSPLLATAVATAALPIDPAFLLLALVAGNLWGCSCVPLSGAQILMASLIGDPNVNSFKMTRWNLVYTMVVLLLECLAITVAYFLFYPS